MTKEECVALLCRYAEYDGMGIPNLAGCREAMKMAADLLSQPYLPDNLDEAAEKYAWQKEEPLAEGERLSTYFNPRIEAFKSGAKWMAKQHANDVAEATESAFNAGKEWMAGQEVKIGETKIYLEDDGDEPPYAQEWLDLESTEFKLPDGAFQPGDEVEVILRKK